MAKFERAAITTVAAAGLMLGINGCSGGEGAPNIDDYYDSYTAPYTLDSDERAAIVMKDGNLEREPQIMTFAASYKDLSGEKEQEFNPADADFYGAMQEMPDGTVDLAVFTGNIVIQYLDLTCNGNSNVTGYSIYQQPNFATGDFDIYKLKIVVRPDDVNEQQLCEDGSLYTDSAANLMGRLFNVAEEKSLSDQKANKLSINFSLNGYIPNYL